MGNQIKAALIARIKRTEDIESFRFQPEIKVNFLPGQFTKVIFDADNPDNSQLNKYLSFSSSPEKSYLEVTKRLSSSQFSQKLGSLKVGDSLLLKPAMGKCFLKEEYAKIAFLVGGIGITPVISILEYIEDKKLATDVALVYSNRTESIAFRRELDNWGKSNSKIKVFYLVTDCPPKDSQCIHGIISQELLLDKLEDLSERVIFIFGPPLMVKAMSEICFKLGCSKDKVRTESFVGY